MAGVAGPAECVEWVRRMSSFATIAQTMRAERLRAAAQPLIPAVAQFQAASFQTPSPRSSASHLAPVPSSRSLATLPETYVQTATFFIALREYLDLSRDQIARQLATHPNVIFALETSDFGALPPWPQTRKLVAEYAALARIDPTPALTCLEYCLAVTPADVATPSSREASERAWPQAALASQSAVHPVTYQPRATPVALPNRFVTSDAIDPVDHEADDDEHEPESPSRWRSALAGLSPRSWPIVRIAAVMIVLSVAGLFTQASTLQAAMARLPAPLNQLMRTAQDAVLVRTSAKFEGMPWINVADPRSRRSDKLPTTHR